MRTQSKVTPPMMAFELRCTSTSERKKDREEKIFTLLDGLNHSVSTSRRVTVCPPWDRSK